MALVKSIFFLGLALLSCVAQSARRGLVDNGATVFDVTKYGAKPDGKTESAQAFIQTWNAACQSTGAAKVLIPPGKFMTGEVFFQGPCKCAGPIVVEVQGVVVAQADLSEFSDGQWFSIQDIEGLIVTGSGMFHGQGELAWHYDSCGGNNKCDNRLPAAIVFDKVNNALVEGINVVNSKGFNVKIGESHNFTIQNVHITAPWDSPNTDGIHVSRSDSVNLLNCVIGTGDDCVSVGEGSTNVAVTGITCGPGHGISIGSLGLRPTEHDVKGVTVTNCTIFDTTNGARIKTWHQSPRLQASGIIFQDIIMSNVRNPIFIDQNYGAKQKPGSSNVKITDVHFKNIRGTTISNVAVTLSCSSAFPCEGIELVDIDFTFTGKSNGKDSSLTGECENAKATFTGKQNPPPCSACDGCNTPQTNDVGANEQTDVEAEIAE